MIETHRSHSLGWTEVSAQRMRRNGLIDPLADNAADIVAAMCGAHAQVGSAAELSIGLRSTRLTRADIREALWIDGTLVKTHGPRGTVHLLPTKDLAMWTGALSAIPNTVAALPKPDRLTAEQTDIIVAAIGEILSAEPLTIDELSEAVIVATGSWAGDLVMPAFNGMWPRWRQALAPAAMRGELCYGPNRGRKVTYTSPRLLLPGFAPQDGDTALAALVSRYLHAYGPATPKHFAQWLATTPKWAAELFETLAPQLERVTVNGQAAWRNAGDDCAEAEASQGLRLLPYFDAYAIACQPRELLFPGAVAQRALGGGQAGNYPVMLIDGVVSGVWHQRRSGRKIHVTVEPLVELSAAHSRELSEQVERIGRVAEGRPELTIGPISVGPHA